MKFKPHPLFYRLFLRLLPLVLLAFVWGIEVVVTRLFGDQTLAPLLSILSLSILALSCSPRLIFFTTPFFVTESYLLIVDHSAYPLVRASTVILGGLLAIWLSSSRIKLHRQQVQMASILQLLPIPWIQTDGTGNILSVGRTALNMFHLSESQLLGIPFFSLFSSADNRGEFIRLFLDAVDNSTAHPHISLCLTRPPHTHFNASISPLSTSKGSSVLIILQADSLPPRINLSNSP